MSNFSKKLHNPIDLIKVWWPDADISHIEYDPKMKSSDRDYWRIEQSGGGWNLIIYYRNVAKITSPTFK